MTVTDKFRAARDHLVSLQEEWERAREEFVWLRFDHLNFGLDWFDQLAASPERRDQDALIILEEDGSRLTCTFARLNQDSAWVANWLREHGVHRGDRVILMLNNQVELWECMLACIKLGAVMIPTTTQMGPTDLTAGWNAPAPRGRWPAWRMPPSSPPGPGTTRSCTSRGSGRVPNRSPHPSFPTARAWTTGTRTRARTNWNRTRPRAGTLPCCCTSRPDHVQAETRGAHPHVLPRGPPLHDVLDRSGTR